MDWKDFISFRKMLTPVIIKVLFWIGLGFSALYGIVLLFGGIIGGIVNGEFGLVIGGLLGGPIVAVLGALGTRLYCELLIVIFQINDTLTDIKNQNPKM